MSKQSELDEILQPIRNYADIVEIDFAREQILDWHNKRIEELLDRLEQVHRANPLWVGMTQRVIPLSAIEAERNKLNPSKSTPFNYGEFEVIKTTELTTKERE